MINSHKYSKLQLLEIKKFLEKNNKNISFSAYKSLIYFKYDKSIDNNDDLLLMLKERNVDFIDVFYVLIDDIKLEEAEELYFDNNIKKFDLQNFMPIEKDVKSGTWIKIRNEKGYELHYAKKSKRKLRFNELIEKYINKFNELDIIYNKTKRKSIFTKLQKIHSKLIEYSIYYKLGFAPYEVFYRKNNTKIYLMPYQYEIADIDEHVQYLLIDVPCVSIVNIFSSINENELHYILSRGIPKKHANILANLKNCYIKVDMKSAINIFNSQLQLSK